MNLKNLTEENTQRFLDELKMLVDSAEVKAMYQAVRVAVKHGFTPGYKIVRDVIDIGFFRYEERRLVCLKQYFPAAATRRFMYYLIEHSLYDLFDFHSPGGGEWTLYHYHNRRNKDGYANSVEFEFYVFLRQLPLSSIPFSKNTRHFFDQYDLKTVDDIICKREQLKIRNKSVLSEVAAIQKIYLSMGRNLN